MKRWTQEEVDFLKEFYPEYGLEHCVNKLCRPVSSIRMKASRLGLKSPLPGKHNKLTHSDYLVKLKGSEYAVLSMYKGSDIKILHRHILCNYEWSVSPNNLYKLVGCPNCSTKGFHSTKPASLYYLYFPTLNLYKVGVSNNVTKRRYDFGKLSEVLRIEYFDTGQQALEAETQLLKVLKPYLINTGTLKSGNTETFRWPN